MDAASRPPDVITPTWRPWIATVFIASVLAVLIGVGTVLWLQDEPVTDAVILPAVIAACLALVVLRIVRMPAAALTITDDEISLGGPRRQSRVITRAASGGALRLFDHGRLRGVFLEPSQGATQPIVIGTKDIPAVRAACEAHGWTIDQW